MASGNNTLRSIPQVDTTTYGQGLDVSKPASASPQKRGRRRSSSDDNAKSLITRRALLFGALGAGAIGAGVVGARALAAREEEDAEIATLSVPEESVFDLESCTEVDAEDAFELAGDYILPYGTLLWTDDRYIAACLFPTEESSPLVHMGILQFTSDEYYILREEAVGAEEGFEIYDVRANSEGLVWVEAAIMQGLWRVYVAPLGEDLSLGEPRLADKGDSSSEVPSITICDKYAFWQTNAPVTNENARDEPAVVKRAQLDTGETTTVYVSKGRMSAPLCAYQDSVIITPRHEDAVSYCDLVRLDAASGRVLERVTLPSGMMPNQVAYGPTGFSFCFESIYDYGGGISNLGTYTPAQPPANGNYDNLTWFRFNRTPTAAPCWCTDNWFMVKSNQSVCAVNLPNKIFCSFGVESGCQDWGDYLVTTGNREIVATSMHIDQIDNEGNETKKTQVRVWRPLETLPESTGSADPASDPASDEQQDQQEQTA